MILQIAGAFLTVLAFYISLEAPRKYIQYAAAVGAIGWAVYLVCEKSGMSVVVSAFVFAVVISLTSHLFARIFKAPVTIFLIAGILPVVPGAGMYRTVYYIMQGNSAMANRYLLETIQIAGMIALAIFITDAFVHILLTKKK